MALVPYEPDQGRESRLRDLQRLTPQERLRRMLDEDAK
jgi:hypothetical protein